MSVETFFEGYSSPVAFRQSITRVQENSGWWRKSIIEVHARAMVRAASDGLRTLEGMWGAGGGVALRDRESPPPRINGTLNYCAVLYGLGIIGAEMTLVERAFDKEWFCNEHNEALRGITIPHLRVASGVESLERLSHEQWMHMVMLAKEDKTLAIFFEPQGFPALPQGIRELFAYPTLVAIRRLILPEYTQRVRALLGD